jgi:trypsin
MIARRLKAALLAALAASAFLVVATAPPSEAVINGSAAAEGAYPFMAALQDGTGFTFCGGSVISSTWVLTAAHCVVDDPGTDLWVVTGRTNLDNTTQGQRIKVDQIHVHPQYANDTHDIAVLHLSSATTSAPIRLATAADDGLEAAGTIVRVTGWGDTLPTLGLFATNQLQQVDLKVVSDDECGQTNTGFDGPTGVCAAELLKDSCNGDSGGPLFYGSGSSRVQIGVVSYGVSCALPKFPGVYGEVNNPEMRSFITQYAGV